MVGTRKIVTAENALSEQGGFYCEPCDYLLKDQKSYLEHCNKAQHLRRMGLPTEVKRSTADDVRARLEALKQKSAGANKSGSGTGSGNVASDAKKKEAGGDKTKKVEEVSKKRAQPEEADQEPDMAAFGLPMSFGSSKK
jgi:U4/U6.U5 tri-snRNP component SNU23